MSINLKNFLLIVNVIYLLIIFKAIKNKKLPIRNSIIWIVFGILFLISIFCQSLLRKICDIIGVEKNSNFLLFGGFMALLILTFDLYKQNNQLKQKLIKLGQEIAILKNEKSNK